MFMCICMVCMVLVTNEVLCARSQDSSFSVSAWGTYSFLYMRRHLVTRETVPLGTRNRRAEVYVNAKVNRYRFFCFFFHGFAA